MTGITLDLGEQILTLFAIDRKKIGKLNITIYDLKDTPFIILQPFMQLYRYIACGWIGILKDGPNKQRKECHDYTLPFSKRNDVDPFGNSANRVANKRILFQVLRENTAKNL